MSITVETIANQHAITVSHRQQFEGARIVLKQGPDVVILSPTEAHQLAAAITRVATAPDR